jgi:hypothetical protein
MSQFDWLDYSEHERRKMLDIVDLFREHDTRDELGVGSVRDTFADLFFPGTSTIMTRARYFLLVAWIYQRLEKQRISSAQIAERARRAQRGPVGRARTTRGGESFEQPSAEWTFPGRSAHRSRSPSWLNTNRR